MVHMVRTFPSTNPFQWWLSRDVWWFWGASKNAEVGHEIDDFFAFFGALLCQGLWTTPLGDGRPKTRGEGGWGMEMTPIDSRENRGSIMRRYGNSSINAGFLREKNGDIADVLQQCLITGTLEDLETWQKWWKSWIDLTSRWKEQLQRTELSTFKFLWASWMIS